MPRAIKKRSAKKELDADLQVQDRIEDIKKIFEKKQKTLVTYGLAVLGVAVITGGIAIYRFNSADSSQKLEYEAYKSRFQDSKAGQDNPQKSTELYMQAYEKKKSPRLLLSIADSYAEAGKYDDALKTLDEFSSKYSSQAMLLPLAYQKAAAVQLKKGNKAEALKALDKIAALPGDVLKDFVLVQKARLLEQDGKKDEAIAKYKELTEKFPQSPYAEEAKNKSGEKKAEQQKN
jgi:predicted negative regulator of RcsB-dependent stress response